MAEEALASLGALPLTRTRLMTWPPRLRALSNIAFRSGSVEFSRTAGTRATGPSARAGIASAATSTATIVTRAETGGDSLVGLFIVSFLSALQKSSSEDILRCQRDSYAGRPPPAAIH